MTSQLYEDLDYLRAMGTISLKKDNQGFVITFTAKIPNLAFAIIERNYNLLEALKYIKQQINAETTLLLYIKKEKENGTK